jgi:hypothetical protein
MRRGQTKLPAGPKPRKVTPSFNAAPEIKLVLDVAQEKRLAETVARVVLAALRAEAPDMFVTQPTEAPRA